MYATRDESLGTGASSSPASSRASTIQTTTSSRASTIQSTTSERSASRRVSFPETLHASIRETSTQQQAEPATQLRQDSGSRTRPRAATQSQFLPQPSVVPSLSPPSQWSRQPGCHPIGHSIGGFRSFAPLAFHPPPPGQPVTYPLVKLSGGETYQGEWNWYNGKIHGKGTLTYPPGPRDGQYTGEFRDGLRHGQGTLQRPRHPRPGNAVTDADGTYTGQWCKHQRHGQGTFTSVDGTKWTGTWCRDMKDGQFTKISPDGNEVKEEWRNDRLEGRAGAVASMEMEMERVKVASLEMEMERLKEREREWEREIQEEKEKLFQDMAEERAEEIERLEAEWQGRYRELQEQYARDRQEAEQKNTALMEQMKMNLDAMANLKEERKTSGIDLTNYNKKVQEIRSEFLTCVQNLAKVKTPNWSIGLVGRTNAGKSSLLNRMFGTTCKVGATRCTTGVQQMWTDAVISVWDVFGFNDEEAYESIETIKTFVTLHAVLLLYRDSIQSCKNTIELFRAADVKVIVVRSQIDTLTPEELKDIEQEEAPKAKEYGAYHWTKTTTKSGKSADELKEYILSLAPVSLGDIAPGSCVAPSVDWGTVEEWSPEQLGELSARAGSLSLSGTGVGTISSTEGEQGKTPDTVQEMLC